MTKRLIRRLGNAYIFIIGFCTVPLLYLTIPAIGKTAIPELLFWIALEIAADLKHFKVQYRSNMDMTVSFAVQMAAVIVLGTYKAVFVVIIATLIVEIIFSKKAWYKVLFNAGQYGLSLFASGFLFYLLKQSPQNVPVDIIEDLPAILTFISTYFLLNTFFISAVISLTEGSRFSNIFMGAFKIIIGNFYALVPISLAAALLYRHDRPYIVLIMAPPLFMADMVMRKYYTLSSEAQETLRVLAGALDEKDRYTASHSAHVAEYAVKIAVKLSLNPEEANEIEMAGQVHDLGKVAIPDSILNKNAELTEEEYNKIKEHPVTAYNLLKNLKPYKKCAEYVLHHHERVDGNGYPDGLDGPGIPLGARILSVADSYDAMTTDRPYRKALSQSSAVCEMVSCSGTQFDPEVVNAFIEVLKNDYGYTGE